MPTTALNSLDLAMPEDGKAPEMRLKDAGQAVEIVKLLVDANRTRAAVDARVKGSLDGVPPFNQAKLRAEAQAHRCNVNFREAEGLHTSAVTPYYDLFAEAACYCEIKTDHGKNVFDRNRWSKILTTEHDRMLKEWDGFDYNIQLIISEMVDFGIGLAMWPDDKNWQFRAIKKSKVYVADGSPANIDDQEIIVVREECAVHDLWKYIRKDTAANSVGWTRSAVLREIKNATPPTQGGTTTTDDIEATQQRIRNNDLYESMKCSKVKLAHLFVKEFDGKISHLIVAEQAPKADAKKDAPKTEFLFKKKGRYESFRQAVAAIFYDIGDGTWHSVKGLLVKVYPFIELKNRGSCAVWDSMFLNMGVLCKTSGADGGQKMGMVQLGPLSILPPHLEVQQWGLVGKMEEALVVDRHFEQKLASNIGTYRTTVRKESGNPETATKVMADQGKEAMLNKGSVNRFYSQLDCIFEELYRRASKAGLNADDGGPNDAALEFQKRCMDQGVPREAFKKVRVRAYRNIGNGSIFMRQQSFRDSSILVPMMNEEGRSNWLDDAIAVTTNYDMVERYNPKDAVGPTVAEQQNHAALENAAMKVGVRVAIVPTDNHVIHADSHIAACSQALASVQQGGNPADVLAFADIAAPHAMQHIQKLENDPSRKREVQTLTDAWKKMAALTQQLEAMVKQSQQQQQQQVQRQRQVMNDQQLKAATAQSDMARKDRKAQVDMALKGRKAQQALAIKDATAAQTIELKQQEHDAIDHNGSGS